MPADLFAEHRAITEATDAIVAVVTRGPRVSIEELTRRRARLSMLIMAHLMAENEQIHAPLTRLGGLHMIPGAKEVFAASHDLRGRYSAHIRKWTLPAIGLDWDGYGRDMVQLSASLRGHLAREEAQLYHPALELIGEEGGRRAAGSGHKVA